MATEPSGILVPAYVIPTPGAWQPVLDVASAMMLGGLIVVANDGNGPGYNENTHTYDPPSQDYINVIDALHRQCALVVGYVFDCWANTNPPNASNCPRSHEITADIDRWFGIGYDIDGIFIDQVLDTDLSRAVSLITAVRSHRSDAVVVLNPGRLPAIEFMYATDPAIVVIQERPFAAYNSWPPAGWVQDRAAGNFGDPPISDDRLAIIANTDSVNPNTNLELLIQKANQYAIKWIYGQDADNYNMFSILLPEMARRLDRCSRLGCIGFGQIFCRIGLAILCYASRMRQRLRLHRTGSG
jgi:hypothetical protein